MNEISIGKYNITFYEVPDYNEKSADNLPYDEVIDFDDGFNKTIAAEISDGIDTRKIALIVPYYTPHEDFALPMGDKVFLMLNDILCVFDPETGKVEKETHIDPMGTMFGVRGKMILPSLGYDVFWDDEKPLIAKGVRDRINLILQNIRGLITKWNGINLSYL